MPDTTCISFSALLPRVEGSCRQRAAVTANTAAHLLFALHPPEKHLVDTPRERQLISKPLDSEAEIME